MSLTSHGVLVAALWRSTPAGEAILVATADACLTPAQSTAVSPRVSIELEAPNHRRDAVRSDPGSTASVLKYPQETGLPWTVRVADADPHATLNAFASRRRLLLAGLGLLSVLVVAGSYFIWRAMARELAAAGLQVTFLVRSAADPAALVHVMDRVVPEVAKDVAIPAAETVDSTRRFTLRMSRFFTWLLVAFAGAALALAAVGVFGVMPYEVARRTHEIGIRMALGAHPRDVLRLILRNGLFMTSIGLAIGLGSSLALARFLEIRLGELGATEVKPTDPGALVAVCLLLALLASLACYIPAHRAARTNPLTSLRYE